jgi:hypothetical protein
MRDNDLLTHWRRHYDAPDADNEAVLAETEARFLQQRPEDRKMFVDALETNMLDWDQSIGIRERGERMSLHRRFSTIHQNLKRLGR